MNVYKLKFFFKIQIRQTQAWQFCLQAFGLFARFFRPALANLIMNTYCSRVADCSKSKGDKNSLWDNIILYVLFEMTDLSTIETPTINRI